MKEIYQITKSFIILFNVNAPENSYKISDYVS